MDGRSADRLDGLRSLLGETATVWAGGAGTVVRPDRWAAISGARSVDYNVVVCHSGTEGCVEAGLEELLAAGAPGVLMLAGGALGQAQVMVGAGWVCIGSTPFMELTLPMKDSPRSAMAGAPAAAVVRCGAGRLDGARALVQEVFSLEPEHALVALPPDAADRPGQVVWVLERPDGRPVSCLIAVRRGDAIGIWSMATAPDAQRSGYGSTLLSAALAGAADEGAERCLLYASRAGEPLYRRLGFRELERWQLWSRPRWVLGRA